MSDNNNNSSMNRRRSMVPSLIMNQAIVPTVMTTTSTSTNSSMMSRRRRIQPKHNNNNPTTNFLMIQQLFVLSTMMILLYVTNNNNSHENDVTVVIAFSSSTIPISIMKSCARRDGGNIVSVVARHLSKQDETIESTQTTFLPTFCDEEDECSMGNDIVSSFSASSSSSSDSTTTSIRSRPRPSLNRLAGVGSGTTTTTSSGSANNERSTALDMVCNSENGVSAKSSPSFDKNDFEMHVGRALDTLRKDYPRILTEDPDYSIYDTHMEVVDPSGVRVRGLKSYRNAFRLMHALIRFLYCPSKSSINVRMCYDQARHNIRIHWNVYVVPREIFGGSRVTNYVDGISVYEFDQYSGNITEHRIERLLWNDKPIMPEEGVIAALQRQHTVSVPSFIQQQQQQLSIGSDDDLTNIVLSFQAPPSNIPSMVYEFALNGGRPVGTLSSLFALEASSTDTSNFDNDNDQEYEARIKARYPTLNWTGFLNKNQSRKKFGLKPLSPEEYLELEIEVQQLAMIQRQKQLEQQQQRTSSSSDSSMNSDQATTTNNKKKKYKNGSILQKMFGDALRVDSCESNYDCDRPEVCCDFGFQKKCCYSGALVGRWDQMQPIRVPADMNNYPPNQPPPYNNNNGGGGRYY